MDEEIVRLMEKRDESGLALLKKRYGNMLRCSATIFLRNWDNIIDKK